MLRCVSHVRSSRGEPAQECGLVQSLSAGNNGALARCQNRKNQGMCYNLGTAGDSAAQDIKDDARSRLTHDVREDVINLECGKYSKIVLNSGVVISYKKY